MKKKQLNSLIKIVLTIVVLLGGYTVYDNYYSGDTVRIANWNLQIFGQTKAANSDLMEFYVDKIDDYDIIFVQEIRDSSETAFPELCSMLLNYSCLSSSRAGRSSSKEQYGVIYKNGINVTSVYDFNPDSEDRWERPPIKVVFEINDYLLTAYNIHTKPGAVENELNNLQGVITDSGNVIILGDLNADCSYYNNDRETEFDNWNWVVIDSEDTTVAATDCAYDRIILNSDAYQEYVSYGIDTSGINDDVSDHYLVWVELEV